MNVKLTFPVVLFLLLCLNTFLPAKSVECPALTNPQNGLVVCSSRGYLQENDSCTFSCNPGYHLQVVCGADGQWTGTVPTCAGVKCPNISSPLHGRMICDSGYHFRYPEVCNFNCDWGYELTTPASSSERRCQTDATWSGNDAVCIGVQCPDPRPTNGLTTCDRGSTFRYPETCSFACNSGYRLSGSTRRTCQADRRWSGSSTTCTVDCPALTSPQNGRVDCTDRLENDRCTFSCNHGYHLLGSSQVVCGSDGQWSGTVPTCAVECPALTSPQNGRVTCTDRLENDRCTFSCNYGYHLLGSSQVVCGSDGQWTGTVPTCAACPSGYTYHQHSRSCYKAFNQESDYNGAKATCSSDGGTLAMPRDAVTNTFLINLKNAVDTNADFIFGLTDIHQEGRWVWEDGAALGGFSSWGPGQPDNRWNNEDCVEYVSANYGDASWRNKWGDIGCSYYPNNKFICQVPPT